MTPPDHAPDSPRRAEHARRAVVGPYLLLFPLLLLAIAVAWLQDRRPEPAAPPRSPETAETHSLPTWRGESVLAAGGVLYARLARLHARRERQTFDAAALSGRLGLESGEPWHLELTWTGDSEGAPLELGRVSVHDDAGQCQTSLPAPEPGALADPLAVLFQAPASLGHGEKISFLLWGEEPADGAWLEGLGPALELRPGAVEVRGDGAAIASLRRRVESPVKAGPAPTREGGGADEE